MGEGGGEGRGGGRGGREQALGATPDAAGQTHTARRLPLSAVPPFLTAVRSPHAKQSYAAPSVHQWPRRTQNRQQNRVSASKECQAIKTLLACQSRVDTQGGEKTRGQTPPHRERGKGTPNPSPNHTPLVAPRQAASRCGRGKKRGGSPAGAGGRARRLWLRMSRSIQDTARPAGDSSRMVTTGTAVIRHGRGVQRGRDGKRRWRGRGRPRTLVPHPSATAPVQGQRAAGSGRGSPQRADVRT